MRNIIFHLPLKIDANHKSASQIRPLKILEAFRTLEYNVDVIEGDVAARKRKIALIKKKIKGGFKYDFMYSESSTMPTLLTSRKHFPLHPFFEFNFFKFCKYHSIPIGLFYRDIYWCFDENNITLKSRIAYFFYKYDLYIYNKYVDALFLPSLKMLAFIPYNLQMKTYALPPGCMIRNSEIKRIDKGEKINILYVGGITDGYNLDIFIKTISNYTEFFSFSICVREDEWEKTRFRYEKYVSNNIQIIFPEKQNLDELYSHANLFCLFVEPIPYWKFAAPFKLFEAIGYGVPFIVSRGTYASEFIEQNGIGMVVNYSEKDLNSALLSLIENKDKLNEYKQSVVNIQLENTWLSRIAMVDHHLQCEK